jgi:hypothetical protein
VGNPLPHLSNYPSHYGSGSFLSYPPGHVITESIKDSCEREVGGKAVHTRKDEIANQVENVLSLRLQHLPQPLRERVDPPGHLREPEGNVPSDSEGISGGSRPNVSNAGLT